MAVLLRRGLVPDAQLIIGTVAGPASYATGGFALDVPPGGNPVFVTANPIGGYNFSYDYTNKLLVAYRTGAINVPEVQASNGDTGLNGLTIRFFAVWAP